MSDQSAAIIYVNLNNWMKPIQPKNVAHRYYEIGKVVNLKNTILVVPTNGNGSLKYLLCTLHNNIYDQAHPCPECHPAMENTGKT